MKKRLLCIILAAIELTACSYNGKKYVLDNKITGVDINAVNVNFVSDDSFVFKYAEGPKEKLQSDNISYDKDHMYIFGMGEWPGGCYAKLSLQTGELKGICDIVGCGHTKPECIYQQGINNPKVVGDELWFVKNDKLYSHKLSNIGKANMTDSSKILFQNTYSTQFEKDNFSEYPNQITGFTVTDDSIIIMCSSYLFKVDRITMKADELIKISEYINFEMCVDGNTVYLSNYLDELYKVNLEKRTVTKLGDLSNFPSVYEEKLYYIKWIESIPWLCSASLDGTDEKKLIKDCYINYLIKDGYVIYGQFAENRKTYVCSLDTLEKSLISDLEMDRITSAPQIDRVLLFSSEFEEGDNIYTVKFDGSDAIKLQLDKYYTRRGDFGLF